MNDQVQHSASSRVAPEARGGELLFAAAFVVLLVVCSFGSGKLYPFEPPSFFVAAAHQYAQYRITDPAGRALRLDEFGIGDFYAGQAGYATGVAAQEPGAIRLPPTVVVYGEVRTREEMERAVKKALQARGGPEYVIVSQRVIGPTREHPGSVGVIAQDEWRVSR